MRHLLGIAVVVVLGCLAWQVGNRLSTDAVGMAVGLVFGTLAGVPAALLVLSTSGRRRNDDYDAAYHQQERDLYLGTLPPGHQHTAQWVDVPQLADDAMASRYTVAHPFALVNVRRTTTGSNGVVLEENHLLPAEVAERLYGKVSTPADPEACPDWCEPWVWHELYDNGKSAPQYESLQERRYRVDWGA